MHCKSLVDLSYPGIQKIKGNNHGGSSIFITKVSNYNILFENMNDTKK